MVTASLSEIKSEYPYRAANPNRITQSLIAVLAGLGVPFLCTESHELGEEMVASYLYQTFLYDWLDRNGHGRYLADGDLYCKGVMASDVMTSGRAALRAAVCRAERCGFSR